MADDKQKRGPADRARININDPYDLQSWADHFGTTKAEIQAAVMKVGPLVKDVKDHLRRK